MRVLINRNLSVESIFFSKTTLQILSGFHRLQMLMLRGKTHSLASCLASCWFQTEQLRIRLDINKRKFILMDSVMKNYKHIRIKKAIISFPADHVSFFIFFHTLCWLFLPTKYIKSKYYYSLYSWIFSTIQYQISMEQHHTQYILHNQVDNFIT